MTHQTSCLESTGVCGVRQNQAVFHVSPYAMQKGSCSKPVGSVPLLTRKENSVSTRQKPQQDSMPAYFYCCTCWHLTTPHNGICSACRSTTMAYTVHAEAPQWHTQCMQKHQNGHTQCLQKHHNGIHSACRSTTMAYTVHAEAPQWHTQCMHKIPHGLT